MKSIKELLLSQNLYVVLLTFLLVSIPLPFAFSSIAVVLFFAASLASSAFHKVYFRKEFLVPFLFYGLMIISLLWSVDLGKSLRGLERELSFVLIPAAFMLMPQMSRKGLFNSIYYFAISVSILAIFFILNATYLYALNGKIGVFFYHRLVEPFDLNAIYISVLSSLSLLYLIFYKSSKIIDKLIIVILSVFVLLLSSKNVVFITVFSIVLGVLLYKKINLKRFFIMSGITAGIAVILFLSPLKNRWDVEFNSNLNEVLTCQEFGQIYPWTGSTIRLFQARIFYELLQENQRFLTGFGMNASQDKIVEKQNKYDLYCGYNPYNYHNQYIQAFSDLGVLGFIFILLLLWVLFGAYLKTKELWILFFFLAMLSVFISESYLWRQRGIIHFLAFYGICIQFLTSRTNLKDS